MSPFVLYVPTSEENIDAFFELAPVAEGDVVYDLGCGDGRLLIAAVEQGAGRAVGVDIDPEPVRAARAAIRRKGLKGRVKVLEMDMMNVSVADATVVVAYLSTAVLDMLRPKLEKELKPGTRVVVEDFPVPGWQPEKVVKRGEYRTFYRYLMPPQPSA
jgi:ribosomal protein L11 methylase PrmA